MKNLWCTDTTEKTYRNFKMQARRESHRTREGVYVCTWLKQVKAADKVLRSRLERTYEKFLVLPTRWKNHIEISRCKQDAKATERAKECTFVHDWSKWGQLTKYCAVDWNLYQGDVTDSTGISRLRLRVGGLGFVTNGSYIITGKTNNNLAFAA